MQGVVNLQLSIPKAQEFIRTCSVSQPGEYKFHVEGDVSLYASCFAALALQTLGQLGLLKHEEREKWVDYINSWQDPSSGYFLGPEISTGELIRDDLDLTYAKLHLMAHVLPVLKLLGSKPAYPLKFALAFLELDYLDKWLSQRDWRRAWIEGNNLLFIGQLLVYLVEEDRLPQAQQSLDKFFDWLDKEQDPCTGLWGTNGCCDAHNALYGAYHQLLVYFYCKRLPKYADRIIDTVLQLQQKDGSFSRTPGGGACEDIDAIDVLVNLTKRSNYRSADIERALRRVVPHLIRQQTTQGGFVYRWGHSFMQSGLLRTFTPANQADIFSTWFRLHSLALIDQVVDDPCLKEVPWQFNTSCSMGWHDTTLKAFHISQNNRSIIPTKTLKSRRTSQAQPVKKILAVTMFKGVRYIPSVWISSLLRGFLPRYIRSLPPDKGLYLLNEIDTSLHNLGEERAFELFSGLQLRSLGSQSYRFFVNHLAGNQRVWHLGSSNGSLSFSIASLTRAEVVATDWEPLNIAKARSRYHHPRLTFVDANEIYSHSDLAEAIVLTDFIDGMPAWDRWQDYLNLCKETVIMAQLTEPASDWREILLNKPGTSEQRSMAEDESRQRIPSGWKILECVYQWGSLFACLSPA